MSQDWDHPQPHPHSAGWNPNSLSMMALLIIHIDLGWVCLCMCRDNMHASGHVWRSKNSLRGQVPPSPIWVLVIRLRLSGLAACAMKSQLTGIKTQHCFCLFVYVCVCVYVCTLTLRGAYQSKCEVFLFFSLHLYVCDKDLCPTFL